MHRESVILLRSYLTATAVSRWLREREREKERIDDAIESIAVSVANSLRREIAIALAHRPRSRAQILNFIASRGAIRVSDTCSRTISHEPCYKTGISPRSTNKKYLRRPEYPFFPDILFLFPSFSTRCIRSIADIAHREVDTSLDTSLDRVSRRIRHGRA